MAVSTPSILQCISHENTDEKYFYFHENSEKWCAFSTSYMSLTEAKFELKLREIVAGKIF